MPYYYSEHEGATIDTAITFVNELSGGTGSLSMTTVAALRNVGPLLYYKGSGDTLPTSDIQTGDVYIVGDIEYLRTSDGWVTIGAPYATTSTPGIASFDSSDFIVTSAAVVSAMPYTGIGEISVVGKVISVDLSDVTVDIDGLDEDLSLLDSEITSMGATVGAVSSGLSTLATSVTTLESTVSSNSTDIATLNTSLGGKVSIVSGMGLSTNDYTDSDKAVVSSIAELDSLEDLIQSSYSGGAYVEIASGGIINCTLQGGDNINISDYGVITYTGSVSSDSGALVEYSGGTYMDITSDNVINCILSGGSNIEVTSTGAINYTGEITSGGTVDLSGYYTATQTDSTFLTISSGNVISSSLASSITSVSSSVTDLSSSMTTMSSSVTDLSSSMTTMSGAIVTDLSSSMTTMSGAIVSSCNEYTDLNGGVTVLTGTTEPSTDDLSDGTIFINTSTAYNFGFLNIRIPTIELAATVEIELSTYSNFTDAIEIDSTNYSIMSLVSDGVVTSMESGDIPTSYSGKTLIVDLSTVEGYQTAQSYFVRARFSAGEVDTEWETICFVYTGTIETH